MAGVSPVPAQMWQGSAQSRRRCGRGEPSLLDPGAGRGASSRCSSFPIRCPSKRSALAAHVHATCSKSTMQPQKTTRKQTSYVHLSVSRTMRLEDSTAAVPPVHAHARQCWFGSRGLRQVGSPPPTSAPGLSGLGVGVVPRCPSLRRRIGTGLKRNESKWERA